MTRGPRSTRSFAAAGADDIRQVDSGDTIIAYRVAGDGDIPVLVLQPFWTEMNELFSDASGLVAQMANQYRVIAHDRRGTGASQRHPVRITIDAMVEDLDAVLTDAGYESVVVLGMGESGPLAAHFAVQRPDRVDRLVLVDPALRPLTGPGSTMLVHTLRSKPRAGLRVLARTLVEDDETATELGARMARTVDGPTAARLYETFLSADAPAVLSDIAIPALLAFGVLDRIVSEDEARAFQGKMSGARIGFVHGPAGAASALREGWIQIRDFLDEAPPRPRPQQRASLAPRPRDPSEAAGRRGVRARGVSEPLMPIDYVPAGRPPRAPLPAMPPTMAPPSFVAAAPGARPVIVNWGPPPNIPAEATTLNRKGIDQLLLGEIELALESFRQAVEIAPQYEDALINHRELLSRLVHRRVAEWEARQATDAMAESERRAERLAQRAVRTRGRLGWLLGK